MTSKRATKQSSSYRAAPWLAPSLCALSVTLAALGLLFLFLSGDFESLLDERSAGDDAAVAVAFPLVGAFVASRRPANAVGWVLCAIGLSQGVAVFAGEYGGYASLARAGSLPAGVVATWLGTWPWVPGTGLTTTLLLLLFPQGRLPSGRWLPVVYLAAGAIALGSVTLAIAPWGQGEVPQPTGTSGGNPFGIEGARTVVVPLALLSLALWVASTLLCAFALLLRFRRSRGEERQQLKWFVYAGTVTVAILLLSLVPSLSVAGSVLQVVAVPFLPVAVGLAIYRHRLYDIDLVINRTLVYGALTACIVGIYVLVVGYLGAVFRVDNNLVISLVATGVVAVLFQPLRERLQRAVNRLMHGERDDPYTVISHLGRRLKSTLAPEAVLPTIVETVAQTLKLPYAAIALKEDDAFEVAAAYGTPSDEPITLPLTYGKEEIGRLLLAPRSPGETFDPAERRLLDDIAHQAEVAVYAVRLSADLQRSRERLVNAREEERRRLRRDLHDGLGPALGSLALKLDAARNLLSAEPEATDELLAELKTQTQAAIADIRRLVYDLRPPALDELGLVAAIREQAANYALMNGSGEAPTFTVEAPESLPDLPAAVEVAAYRIAQEAITNTARHAGARACKVCLSLDDELRLEVIDDGVGLPEERAAGVGLSSMRERAAELGGTCLIEPTQTGGTRVLARLPLEERS